MRLISWALIGVYGIFFSIFMVKKPVSDRKKEHKYEQARDMSKDTSLSVEKKTYYEYIYNKTYDANINNVERSGGYD